MPAKKKSGLCGSRPNYRTPCTSSEDRLCNIFTDLPVWNEFFWPVGFELRELSPGKLSFVHVPDARVPLEIRTEEKEAAKLLQRLLAHHRCVVSVDLDCELFKHHQQMICGELRRCESLEKLALRVPCYFTEKSLKFVAKLPQFDRLRELELSRVRFDRRSVVGLSKLLASTQSLTTLNITEQDVGPEDAVAIVEGLKQNSTITKLLINASLLREAHQEANTMFADFLCKNKTLRTLGVTSLFRGASSYFRPIIEPLYQNTTLTELNLIGMNVNSPHYQLITDMLRKNRTLTSFHMVDCFCYNNGRISSPVAMWLEALSKNNALEELTMDLSWIEPEECGSLIGALASHKSLRKVTVQTVRDNCVAHICRAIRETRVPNRFFLDQQQVSEDTAAKLPECRELSRIRIDYSLSPRESELLHDALSQLPTCGHVKSLHLSMRETNFDSSVKSFIEEYITKTTALTELDLCFIANAWTTVERPQRKLLQALSKNKGIRWLSIRGIRFDETETDMLVDMLHSSRTLCYLSFFPDDDDLALLLVRKLSANVSRNFTLLRFDVGLFDAGRIGDKFAIDDVVRRNNALVMRAADFVTGTNHKHCAAAAELVRLHPGLVMKVQELKSIDEDEAVSRIKDSLKDIIELDDFMRLSGVVKNGVSCRRRHDGQKQLTDLNFECWLHIRQYLKFDDILNSK
ncbi:uncharacterized protein LOC142766818 [Rhipicephalus microplus]|uniref:uncharacterized protein LOC142766818 n=1 Tax=Rhipicephalus microplus TaxID=6941 RepID=UPI003F6B25D6